MHGCSGLTNYRARKNDCESSGDGFVSSRLKVELLELPVFSTYPRRTMDNDEHSNYKYPRFIVLSPDHSFFVVTLSFINKSPHLPFAIDLGSCSLFKS